MNRIIGLMKKYNIYPVKRLGQNFLTDENMINRLKDAISPGSGDYIIEIGPGLGSLTETLAGNCSVLYCIELDTKLFEVVNDRFGSFPGFFSGNFDILDFDTSAELPGYDEHKISTVKITGNLPYYITTPIIMKFLESNFNFDYMYFMMQKEVAQRILAEPGTKDYGALTVAANYYCEAKFVVNVPPHCFMPQPSVHSTFVEFKKRKVPGVEVIDKELFFKVVKAAFNQRRKCLINALTNSPLLNFSKEEIVKSVSCVVTDEKIRGECLDINTFAKLSNILYGS